MGATESEADSVCLTSQAMRTSKLWCAAAAELAGLWRAKSPVNWSKLVLDCAQRHKDQRFRTASNRLPLPFLTVHSSPATCINIVVVVFYLFLWGNWIAADHPHKAFQKYKNK